MITGNSRRVAAVDPAVSPVVDQVAGAVERLDQVVRNRSRERSMRLTAS